MSKVFLGRSQETIEHAKVLLQIECELAQGHGIAKVMRASDIPKWVASWKSDTVWNKFIAEQNNFDINSVED